MSLIYMINNTASAVLADGIIPLTVIARRKGCAVQGCSNSVILNKAGYYKVTGTVTYTSGSTGLANIKVMKNGVEVPGITASGTVTTATTENNTLAFTGIVRVLCSETGAAISLFNDGIAINTSNVSFAVEYLG